jgi:hypothetical protein
MVERAIGKRRRGFAGQADSLVVAALIRFRCGLTGFSDLGKVASMNMRGFEE